MWYTKLLCVHPPPWKYEKEAGECGNGSRIDAIVDAKGDTVLTNYGSSWTLLAALWAWYETLTEDDHKRAKLEKLWCDLRNELRKGDEYSPEVEAIRDQIEALDPGGYILCDSILEGD